MLSNSSIFSSWISKSLIISLIFSMLFNVLFGWLFRSNLRTSYVCFGLKLGWLFRQCIQFNKCLSNTIFVLYRVKYEEPDTQRVLSTVEEQCILYQQLYSCVWSDPFYIITLMATICFVKVSLFCLQHLVLLFVIKGVTMAYFCQFR